MILNGFTALITGSTSGIGRAISELFAREGANVAITGRNIERGQEVANKIKKLGGSAEYYHADVTNEISVSEMVESLIRSYGKIDILINNAGIVIPGSIVDITLEKWNQTWQTNVTSAYIVSNKVLPHMLVNKSGVIVNISSEAGLKGLENRAAYCASKSALIGLTKAMAVDHSRDGIRINCICPGTIETEMVTKIISNSDDQENTKKKMIDRRITPFLGTVEEIARTALFISSPENKYITGSIISVDGGASAK